VDGLNEISAVDWRSEPEQVISDVTARLLLWMTRTQLGASLDVDKVAVRIETGLCDLMDARAAVILARRLPGNELGLLGVPGLEIETPEGWLAQQVAHEADQNFEMPSLTAPQLLAQPGALLPEEPVFVAQAEPHLQVFAGELWDYVRAATARLGPIHSSLLEIEPPSMLVPLRSLNLAGEAEVVGLLLLWVSTYDGLVSETMRPALAAAAAQAGDWLATALRTERLGLSYRDLASVFASAIDSRDPARAGHSHGVAYYAHLTARALHLSEEEIQRVEFAGLLHDIGKTGVPDDLLHKQTALTDEELASIRLAMVSGGEALGEVEGLREVSAMIRHQGERYDGGGYPEGLSGEAIPVGARILAVAQRFSAMTEPRAGRRAMSVVSGALERLDREAGAALDPTVVSAFLSAMGRRH
jgi:HD-GYP domain-containing protein (c-di-GMP phosphodiesterase class II)